MPPFPLLTFSVCVSFTPYLWLCSHFLSQSLPSLGGSAEAAAGPLLLVGLGPVSGLGHRRPLTWGTGRAPLGRSLPSRRATVSRVSSRAGRPAQQGLALAVRLGSEKGVGE